MKTLIFALSFIGILWTSELHGQPVEFNDPNLKAAVELKLGVTDPTPEDMLRLGVLTAGNVGIKDLTGLEYAINLKQLRLYNNDIVDITPLQNLVKMEILLLYDNDIIDISPLQNLVKMKLLTLSNNEIVNVSPLSGMTEVTSLQLSGNNIHDMNSLATLTNLQTLNLAWNDHIADIGAIMSLPNLTLVYFDGSPIGNYNANLQILAGLTQLESLGVANCNIPNLGFLSKLSNLKYLALFNNSLTDISILADLTKLETLRLNINGITDVTALLDLHHLLSLEIQDNSLSQEAYCEQIPKIIRNNPDITLVIDPNPYFPDYAGDLWGTGCGVDVEDLMLLVSYWLEELPFNQRKLDLAPEVGDGRIDLQDFAVLAHDWIVQM